MPTDLSEEAIALRQWVDSELDFTLLKHIDNSFLGVLRDTLPLALLLDYNYIGTNHLLAAMLRTDNSAASQILRQHQADIDSIYGKLEADTGEVWSNQFTYAAMRSIYLAIEEARSAGVKATAEHLLLGIMLEDTSTAFIVLAGAGVTIDEVRALITEGNASDS
jgi:ATP-dependent Clp protease ATP-binding subunit ClpA